MITSAATFRNLTLQTGKWWREPPPQEAAASTPHADPEHPPFPSILTTLAGTGRCFPSPVTAGGIILVLICVICFTLALLKAVPRCCAPLSVLQPCLLTQNSRLQIRGSETPLQRYLTDGTRLSHRCSCGPGSLSSLPTYCFWTCTTLLCS